MNILAFDTSSDYISIALRTERSYEERLIKGLSPSENLLHETYSLLGNAGIRISDIELAAVTKGPGSFTGLRIAMASAKGLASALSIPLVSVPTLDAMARAVSFYPGPILPALDAKKKRFYFSLRKGDQVIIPDRDGNAEDIMETLRGLGERILVTGPDAELFSSRLAAAGFCDFITDREKRNLSQSIIELALIRLESQGPDDIGEGPVYIRRSDAEEALIRKMEEQNG